MKNIQELKEGLNGNLEEWIRALYPNARISRDGKHFALANKFGDPANGQGSFRITVSGDKRGLCYDFDTKEHMDLVDLPMYAKGLSKTEAISFCRSFLGSKNETAKSVPEQEKVSKLTFAFGQNKEMDKPGFGTFTYRERASKRLLTNKRALEYLYARGLNASVIEHFQLGLGSPVKSGASDALLCPVMDWETGNFFNKSYMYNIPGVSVQPADENGWGNFSPLTYPEGRYNGQKIVFICEGLKDLWSCWLWTRNTKLAKGVFFISSTHGTSLPLEWQRKIFWENFEVIYCGQDSDDSGDRGAYDVARLTNQECKRVRVPAEFGKDWTDFWLKTQNVQDFEKLLLDSPVVSKPIGQHGNKKHALGVMGDNSIDINGAFHNGYLYYVSKVLDRRRDIQKIDGKEEVVIVERYQSAVIRSDGKMFFACKTQAPKGTPDWDRVIRLVGDGTVIKTMPKASKYATWGYDSIRAFLEGQDNTRSLSRIFFDIDRHLRGSVWLPNEADYTLLSLMVIVSYVQAIFDSVPLVLLNGPPGTGKTRLGIALASISNNGMVIGNVSAPTMSRMIDESRGLIVLDDLEAIGNKKNSKDGAFSELIQYLKVSYNKKSGVRLVTDMKSQRTTELNFYGVKIINNTTGVDSILGSRMFEIKTRKMPEAAREEFGKRKGLTVGEQKDLRDELHAWTFKNVKAVDATYRMIHPSETERQEEIAASVRTIAKLIVAPEVIDSLERAIDLQQNNGDLLMSPDDLVIEALRRVVVQGFAYVTVAQIQLELRKIADPFLGIDYEHEIPEFLKPEWIGKKIRETDCIDQNVKVRRAKLPGGRSVRAAKIREDFIKVSYEWAEAVTDEDIFVSYTPKKPADFCKGCKHCQYALIGCDVRAAIEKNVLKKSKSPSRGIN